MSGAEVNPDPSLVEALADKPVVLCLGSGGVGKTTTAAALAIALARAGERVVVLTIDPARRLADALGIAGQLDNEAHRVLGPGDEARGGGRSDGGELWATMLDPGATFRDLVRREATDPAQAERILTNRLFVNLTTSLSGTNEYMAAERLHQLHHDDRFDRVVVDTPPAHHAMDFLDSPSRLTGFIDHRLYRSVLAPRRGLARTLTSGTRLVVRLLGRLVGTELVDDVVSFFADFEGLDEGFHRRAATIDALLSGPETASVLVATARTDRLAEAEWILDNLERRGRNLDALIVNRLLPVDGDPRDPLDGSGPAQTVDWGPLDHNLDQLRTLARQEQDVAARLQAGARARAAADRPVAVVGVPEQDLAVGDLTSLEMVADHL